MLIVLTSEQEIHNEVTLLNRLFEAGLQVLHLRKPAFDIERYRRLLNQIDAKHYQKIMTHEYHELCMEFVLKGIHIQEQPRIDLGERLKNYVDFHRSKNIKVSSSFHTPEVLKDCNIDFDYHLISPVFSSISKKGYKGRGFDVNTIDKTIVGMGGINAKTIPEVFKLGYAGIGVLGGVWNTENPIESFKNMKSHYEQIQKQVRK